MTIRAITEEQFYKATKGTGYHYGKMQDIVREFVNSGAKFAEVENPYLKPASFQASFTQAAKKLGVDACATIRGKRVFLYRGKRDDTDRD
jgi:hypothetical protein